MALHDLDAAESPSRQAEGPQDRLSAAILLGTAGILVLGGAAFAALPWLRLNYFEAYEAMYEAMVIMSVVCR